MTETAPAPRKRFPLLLVISLAVNLFLVGITAGLLGRYARLSESILLGGAGELSPRSVLALVPSTARPKIKHVLAEHGRDVRGLLTDAGRARLETFRVLRTEPLDVEALRVAFASSRARDAALVEASQELVVEMAEALTAEEREALIKNVRERVDERGRMLRPPGERRPPANGEPLRRAP
ncbi:MAG: periplasmic heavy metal sensor [Alphaproteobacteria bacterium]|nr:periplasmic heavy metal sensor [Alphaproteobacteria bacterium]